MAFLWDFLDVILYFFWYDFRKKYFDFLPVSRIFTPTDSTKISPEVSAICKYLWAEYIVALLSCYDLVFSFVLIIMGSSLIPLYGIYCSCLLTCFYGYSLSIRLDNNISLQIGSVDIHLSLFEQIHSFSVRMPIRVFGTNRNYSVVRHESSDEAV